MRCPSCAADIPDGRTTCPACGAVIETDPTVVFVPVPGVQNPPFTPEQAGALGGISGFALVVDRAQDALEVSDHSPVIFTFRLGE